MFGVGVKGYNGDPDLKVAGQRQYVRNMEVTISLLYRRQVGIFGGEVREILGRSPIRDLV